MKKALIVFIIIGFILSCKLLDKIEEQKAEARITLDYSKVNTLAKSVKGESEAFNATSIDAAKFVIYDLNQSYSTVINNYSEMVLPTTGSKDNFDDYWVNGVKDALDDISNNKCTVESRHDLKIEGTYANGEFEIDPGVKYFLVGLYEDDTLRYGGFSSIENFKIGDSKTVSILLHKADTTFTYPDTTISIAWQSTIGGDNVDELIAIQQTLDGGYILGGYSVSGISGDKTEANRGASEADYWVVKLDGSGNVIWDKTIGGGEGDYLFSIQQTTDSGYILGGYSNSGISGDKTEANFGSSDYWVIKLDGSGSIEWQNTIGGDNLDDLRSVQQTTDGGYILGGCSMSEISGDKSEPSNGGWDNWIVKLDDSGNIEWQNTIGGSEWDILYSIEITLDGGYILGGYSDSGISGDKTEANFGSWDYWVIKLDGTGSIEWQNTIGGNSSDDLRSIQQTMDGGYILGGYSWSGVSGNKTEASQGSWDYWVVKLDGIGNIEWQNTIGGNDSDELYSVQQTEDGGYILGGRSRSGISGDKAEASQGEFDYWMIKLDGVGNIEWQNTIGGTNRDVLYSIQQTTDGGYILGGSSRSGISGDKTEASQGSRDYWVIKLNAD